MFWRAKLQIMWHKQTVKCKTLCAEHMFCQCFAKVGIGDVYCSFHAQQALLRLYVQARWHGDATWADIPLEKRAADNSEKFLKM